MKIMKSINKVELQGRVGSVRNGIGAVMFTLATNEYFTSTNDDVVTETTWHVCQVSERVISEQIVKGDWVRVIGSIKNYKYTDQEANEITSTVIIVHQYEVVAKPKEE